MASTRSQKKPTRSRTTCGSQARGNKSLSKPGKSRGKTNTGRSARPRAKGSRRKTGEGPIPVGRSVIHGVGRAGGDKQVQKSGRKDTAERNKRHLATLLSVDLPSHAARARRLKIWGARLSWTAVLVGLLLLSVAVGRLWLIHGVYESERFQLGEIIVSTDGWRDEAWVRSQLGLAETESLLALNLDETSAKLAQDPGVVSAALHRDLAEENDGALEVRILERHPVAWLEAPAHGVRPLSAEEGILLDAGGHAWRPIRLRPEWYSLPVVLDSRLSEVHDGSRLKSKELAGALDLIGAMGAEEDLDSGLKPQRVRLLYDGKASANAPAPFRLEVITVSGQEMLFSLDQELSGSLASQCERLARIDTGLNERGASFKRLNLCLRDEVPVVLARPFGDPSLTQGPLARPTGIDLSELVVIEGQEEAESDYQAGLAIPALVVTLPTGNPPISTVAPAAALDSGFGEDDQGSLAALGSGNSAETGPSSEPTDELIGSVPNSTESTQTRSSFEDDLRSILASP